MLPPRIYKYCHRQDAQSMIENSTFRVGTFAEYRKMEAGRAGIGDDVENVATIDLSYLDTRALSISERRRLAGLGITDEGDGRSGGIRTFGGVRVEIFGPNSFIFCYAIKPCPEDLEHWNHEPDAGYDCCVEIEAGYAFGKGLATSLNARLESLVAGRLVKWGHGLVQYDWIPVPGKFYLANPAPPPRPDPLRKRPKFEWQKEGRVIFHDLKIKVVGAQIVEIEHPANVRIVLEIDETGAAVRC